MHTGTHGMVALLTQLPTALLGPVIGAVLLVIARQYLGGWPDLWRLRRSVLPFIHRLGTDRAPHAFTATDDAIDAVDVSELVPEKAQLPLRDIEFVGVVDAPPATVRDFFREQDQWWPAVFASIQYDTTDAGEPVYEVGSYAQRRGGFLGSWQTHVRLTPRDAVRMSRLHTLAHQHRLRRTGLRRTQRATTGLWFGTTRGPLRGVHRQRQQTQCREVATAFSLAPAHWRRPNQLRHRWR